MFEEVKVRTNRKVSSDEVRDAILDAEKSTKKTGTTSNGFKFKKLANTLILM